MLRVSAIALLTLLALGCASSHVHEEEGSVASAITNGEADDSDSTAVALLQNGAVFCTGVLVNRYVVATAAHCVSGELKPDQVYFGADPKGGDGTFVDVADVKAHPDFDKKTLANDVGVVGLVDAAPVKAAPILDPGTMDDSWLGAEITIVGFGFSTAGGNAGQKRVGKTTIDGIDDGTFHFAGDPAQTCQGDSGGPAYVKIDGKNTVIGLTSFGDADCKQFGRDTRVDVQNDFINSYAQGYSLAGGGAGVPNAGCNGAGRRADPISFIGLLLLVTAVRRAIGTHRRCQAE